MCLCSTSSFAQSLEWETKKKVLPDTVVSVLVYTVGKVLRTDSVVTLYYEKRLLSGGIRNGNVIVTRKQWVNAFDAPDDSVKVNRMLRKIDVEMDVTK